MRGQIAGLSWDPVTKRGVMVVWLPGTSGKRRKHRFRATSEGQARAIARRFAEGVERERLLAGMAPAPSPPPGGTITLAELFASHLGRFLAGKRPATVEFYRAVRTVVERDGVLPGLALDAFRKPHIEDFMLRVVESGRATTTAANYGIAVVALLRWAVDRDLIAEYPIKKRVEYPERAKPELEMSPDEERALLAAFEEPVFRRAVETTPTLRGYRSDPGAFDRFRWYFPLLLAGMRTGMRKGDLLGLRWSQVKLDEGWIETVTAKKRVPIALGITPDLRAALEWCKERAGENEQVFLRHDGEPWTVQSAKDAFDLAKKVAGIKRRLRFHDATRHTLGSALVTEGMTLEEVAAILGHRDVRSTARYARVRSDVARKKFLETMARRVR